MGSFVHMIKMIFYINLGYLNTVECSEIELLDAVTSYGCVAPTTDDI